MRRTAAIVLAAGLSSRLGRFKPLLELGGVANLKRAVELFRSVGVAEIIVVCGHRGEEVAAEAKKLGAEPVINPDYRNGMFSSVLAGFKAIPTGMDEAFVLPVDIPLVRPATLHLMQKDSGTAPLVIPCFKGEPGHPPLIRAEVFSAILAHDGARGLAGALEPFQAGAVEVATFDRNILLDLDTPQDLEMLRKRTEVWPTPDHDEAEALAGDVLQMSPELLAHGHLVASLALHLAKELNGSGAELDLDLIRAAALVHDLAKGEPHHHLRGAEVLRELGLEAMAEIVANHTEVTPSTGPVTEAELVCLADKYCKQDRLVALDSRFEEKLALFGHDSVAAKAIKRRRSNARALAARVEEVVGRPMAEILAGFKP